MKDRHQEDLRTAGPRRSRVFAALIVTLSLAAGCRSALPAHSLLQHAASKVDTIAAALRQYQIDHDGALPATLLDLCPRYLPDGSALWLQGTRSTSPVGAALCYVPRNPVANPDDPGQSMIAFMASETDGGRMIIDARLKVWFVGEARFQEWLNGTPTFSARRERPEHDGGQGTGSPEH